MNNSGSIKFRGLILALPFTYLAYTFVYAFACQDGIMGCSFADFAPVFPFYLLVAAFVSKLNFVGLVSLYIISSVVYFIIFYYFSVWIEQAYNRHKYRPHFVLKKIIMH